MFGAKNQRLRRVIGPYKKKKYLVNGHTQNQIYVIALTKENNECKLGLDWGCQAVHCEI